MMNILLMILFHLLLRLIISLHKDLDDKYENHIVARNVSLASLLRHCSATAHHCSATAFAAAAVVGALLPLFTTNVRSHTRMEQGPATLIDEAWRVDDEEGVKLVFREPTMQWFARTAEESAIWDIQASKEGGAQSKPSWASFLESATKGTSRQENVVNSITNMAMCGKRLQHAHTMTSSTYYDAKAAQVLANLVNNTPRVGDSNGEGPDQVSSDSMRKPKSFTTVQVFVSKSVPIFEDLQSVLQGRGPNATMLLSPFT
ncbi:hypothetical protein VNO80_12911 [Phaseolus coccineus]|uniref:Uncharacterized protein n=1 Tax=Phaseolus coccineus TaxID=3886 RepID=A0AAN9N102_PHACN